MQYQRNIAAEKRNEEVQKILMMNQLVEEEKRKKFMEKVQE